ncbi:MAG: gamma-glutamyltransferase, partial [Planctomycetota bacterium]|nr:gamma-glutamyltransferase [Planctomycetota bacterium]
MDTQTNDPAWTKTLYAGVLVFLLIAVASLFRAPASLSAWDYQSVAKDSRESAKSKGPQVAEGRLGAVATASPESSEAGIAMLRAGGNAVDAFVAASFAVSVTRPQSTGIGGGGFLVYFNAKSKESLALDFRETAPSAAHRDMYKTKQDSLLGPRAAGIPGLVKGLVEFHAQHGSGKIRLAQVLQPAIDLAEKGFAVDSGLAKLCKKYKALLQRYPASAAVFVPNGVPLKKGDWLVQPDLAWTLKQIAEGGSDAFYKGPVAEKIAKAMKRDGGLLTEQDFANYQAVPRTPLEGKYHDRRILTMPPPAGGMHLLQMLNILEEKELGQYKHNHVNHIHLMAEAMKYTYADRAVHSGDPGFWKVPTKWLTSKSYAREIADKIDLEKAQPSKDIAAGTVPKESKQTTHISVVDRFGSAVSSTQTVNTGLGSKYVAEGTGILMNNEMDDFGSATGRANFFGAVTLSEANLIEPGKRPLSSMSPTLVFDPQDRLIMAVGTPGGTRIMTSVLQVIINRIDFALSPKECVHAPRMHHQWSPEELRLEKSGFKDETLLKALKARRND